MNKLFVPGYAGELNKNDYNTLYAALKESSKLREEWGLGPSPREKTIRRIAMEGNGKDYYANGRAVKQ